MHRERPLWLLCCAVLAMFWRPLTTGTFFFRDLYQLFYPKKQFLVAAIRSGQIPLWDPLTNGGQPFLASPNNMPFYPSNLLFFVLPFRFAFNFDLVLHVLLCACAAYWLGRRLRANIAFSSVPIAAGSHTIVRRYAPRIWIPAILGTLLTILIIAATSLHTRFRRPRPYSEPSL